jgi:PAS domain S-box-containing protein
VTAVQALRGNSSAQGTTWRGTPFDDDRDLPDLQRVEDQLGLLYVCCAKAWVATLFGDHKGAEQNSDLAYSFLVAAPVGLEKAMLTFISGLRRARELRENPDRPESEQALEEQRCLLERFASMAPMNFAHKLSLVQAETHRARGEVLPAMQTYEKAARGAMENGYLNEAGLAHALAAEYHRDLGLHQAALHNAEQATQAWQSWGAHALVESFAQRFADLPGLSGLSWQSLNDAGKPHTTITQPITPIQLDMESIISASQMLSAETDFEQLLTKMITLVMANSGAETAMLLIKQDKNWFVQARGDSSGEKYDVLLNQPFDPADRVSGLIPEPVFNYCQSSREELVVGDAKQDSRFKEDGIVQAREIRSMACIPVLSKGELKAMVYLENRQLADVFNLERIDVLKHLYSQFGISTENVLLYDSLAQKIQELQESDERYELTIAGSTAGLWDWNITSNKVYYSDRFKEFLGYAPDEFGDTPEDFFDRLHPDDYDAIRLAVDKHLEERIPYKVEYRLQNKSGEYRWFYARAQALWDKKGIATRMSGSIVDISERKQAEVELHHSLREIKQLKNQLEAESAYLQDEIKLTQNFESIIGESDSLKYVLRRVEQVAPSDSVVLIMGETGTGKELIARAIHKLSLRSGRAMIKVNCAALPRELIESELFGHEKGAFTGATSLRQGRFEIANGSTLFLDEIGELPLELQAKLLRVLESGEYERLGSSKTLHSDARMIVATNRVLEAEVKKRRFREDLWYRLKVFPITVPPLRERLEDIPLLVRWKIDQLSRKMGKSVSEISKATMEKLQSYAWPGNVRELEHAIESALITSLGGKLNFDLPTFEDSKPKELKIFEEMERDYIIQVLKEKKWKIGGKNSAASVLGLNVSTLRGRMKKLGIKKPKPE